MLPQGTGSPSNVAWPDNRNTRGSSDRPQGRTKDEAKYNLAEAIELILEDRLEVGLRGVPADAIKEVVSLG